MVGMRLSKVSTSLRKIGRLRKICTRLRKVGKRPRKKGKETEDGWCETWKS
jgi:hypothetical protein